MSEQGEQTKGSNKIAEHGQGLAFMGACFFKLTSSWVSAFAVCYTLLYLPLPFRLYKYMLYLYTFVVVSSN